MLVNNPNLTREQCQLLALASDAQFLRDQCLRAALGDLKARAYLAQQIEPAGYYKVYCESYLKDALSAPIPAPSADDEEIELGPSDGNFVVSEDSDPDWCGSCHARRALTNDSAGKPSPVCPKCLRTYAEECDGAPPVIRSQPPPPHGG